MSDSYLREFGVGSGNTGHEGPLSVDDLPSSYRDDIRRMLELWDSREEERHNPEFEKLLTAHHGGVLPDYLREHGREIAPDFLENESTPIDELDPSALFILRAMVGQDIFTPKELKNIRAAWCGMDLPDALYQALKEPDDDGFLEAVRNAGPNPGMQRGIHGLEKSGYLEKLVQEGRQRRADQARGSVGQPQA